MEARMVTLKLATKLAGKDESKPAYAALMTHRAALAKLHEELAAWGSKETSELAHVRAFSEAQSALTQLEQARVDAQADAELLGRTDVDVTVLTRDIDSARSRAGVLKERERLAEAKIMRIRGQRGKLRDQITELNTYTRELQHAARLERLVPAMEALLEAEAHYRAALEEAFGVAASIDELARAPGVQLPFAGQLPLGDLVLPRPFHPDYSERPSPMRQAIAEGVAAVAEGISNEL
jgi:hypothetical protein